MNIPDEAVEAAAKKLCQRDELIEIIKDVYPLDDFDNRYEEEAADKILAAGYRKPRKVNTVEELEALPKDSLVRTNKGFVFEKDGHWWAEPGTWDKSPVTDIDLPATVLYVGGDRKDK